MPRMRMRWPISDCRITSGILRTWLTTALSRNRKRKPSIRSTPPWCGRKLWTSPAVLEGNTRPLDMAFLAMVLGQAHHGMGCTQPLASHVPPLPLVRTRRIFPTGILTTTSPAFLQWPDPAPTRLGGRGLATGPEDPFFAAAVPKDQDDEAAGDRSDGICRLRSVRS